MKSFEYVIKDKVGIHARPASMLVNKAKQFSAAIIIKCGDKEADCKKLMKLMAMGIICGDLVTVTAEGADEETAVKELESFFNENL